MTSQWPSPARAWYATFVLMVAYTLSYIDRQILSMLVGPIKADLGVSDTQIGLLQGLAFAVFYTLIGIPMGRLADRGNRKRIIAWGIFVWSLATALSGLARNFGQLFAARVAVGVGEAALGPAAYSMIADQFRPERRGRALGVYSMGVYLGIGLAAIIGGAVVGRLAGQPPLQLPLLGELAAWQVAFMVVGLPGVLVALWVATLAEPSRQGLRPAADSLPRPTEVIGLVLKHRRFFLAHFAGISLLTLSFNAVAFWMPPFLQRVHGLTPGEFGTSLGLILAIGGAAGILTGGMLADSLRQRGHADAEIWPGIISALAVAPLGIGVTVVGSGEAALAVFAGFMFFSSFPFAAAAAALQAGSPNRMRGQVSAAYLFFVNLAGIGLGSFLTGFLNDFVFADELRIGESMAWIVGVAAPLAALLLWSAREPYSRRLRDS
ncbi:MAG: spinster family MFS transporter [Steroidobacteraceae bacterium]